MQENNRLQQGVELGYAPKLLRRVEDAINRSGVSVVGGQLDGNGLRARHLIGSLPQHFSTGEALRDASYNVDFPAACSVLSFSGDIATEAYVEGIGGEDLQNLPGIGSRLARGEEGVVIRTVLGATESMPFRGLSYILPGLVMLEKFKKLGINPPQFQVISAHHISAGIDHLDPELALEQAKRFSTIARAYVEKFFPDIDSNTVFLEDQVPAEGSFLGRVMREGEELLVNNLDIDLQMQLQEKGRNNGAPENALIYGAAHLLLHDIQGDTVKPITEGQAPIQKPKAIISIGGKQERLFYQLRHSVRNLLPNYDMAKTMQLFTKHHVPPYYLASDGDVSLQNVIMGENYNPTSKTAQFDTNFLVGASNKRGYFEDFVDLLRKGQYV